MVLLQHFYETIKQQCLLSWQTEEEYWERNVTISCGSYDSNISKSLGLWIFIAGRFSECLKSRNEKFGSLEFFSGPFSCSLWWPVLTSCFYRLISGSKRFLISCPIKDNQESYLHWSANPSSGPYLIGTGKTLLRRFDQWEQ